MLANGQWEKEMSMNFRTSHFAMTATGPYIIKTGGLLYSGSERILLNATEYWRGFEWEIGPEMPFGVFDHCQVADFIEKKLYIFGKFFSFHHRTSIKIQL